MPNFAKSSNFLNICLPMKKANHHLDRGTLRAGRLSGPSDIGHAQLAGTGDCQRFRETYHSLMLKAW